MNSHLYSSRIHFNGCMERLSWDLCNRSSLWLLLIFLFLFSTITNGAVMTALVQYCCVSGLRIPFQRPNPRVKGMPVLKVVRLLATSLYISLLMLIIPCKLVVHFSFTILLFKSAPTFFCPHVYLLLIYKSSLYMKHGNPLALLAVEHTPCSLLLLASTWVLCYHLNEYAVKACLEQSSKQHVIIQ